MTDFHRRIARGLALALLAGPWEAKAMRERAREALGEPHRCIAPIVRALLRHYPTPPHDDEAACAALIGEQRAFYRAFAPGEKPLRIRRWFPVDAECGSLRFGVPAIPTPHELTDWLGVAPAELQWFADRRGWLRAAHESAQHFACRWLPKRSGGTRLVEAPKPRLKALQRRILRDLLERLPPHEAAHGFVRGRSVHTHVAPHSGHAVVLKFDLEDFFTSVTVRRVYGVFRSVGYPDEVARVLAALCTTRTPEAVLAGAAPAHTLSEVRARRATLARLRDQHLPQGAPTSPALANLVAFKLDARLSRTAHAIGANYTRYADDLTFSGDAQFRARAARFQTFVFRIADEEGFALNLRKTRIMPAGRRQEVLGVVVNEHPTLRRDQFDALRALLHNCARLGPTSQNRGEHPHFRDHLLGKISWVTSLHPAKGAKLRTLYDRIRW